jgi:outer membrane lipoprotein SlyB
MVFYATKENEMKSFKLLLATAALVVSTHVSACLLCDSFPSQVAADSTLSYGTVVSVEPVDRNEVDYSTMHDHAGAQVGAAVTGGSLTGAIVGGVASMVVDAVVHKGPKVIDGYVVTIQLDNGKKWSWLARKTK